MILLFVNFHSSSDLQSVSKKLNVRGRGRESRDRRLYRGAGTEGGNIYVQRKDNNVLLSRNIQHEMFEIFIEETFEFDEKIYCFPD